MSSSKKMELSIDYAAVGALLRGSEVKDMLTQAAGEIQGRAGAAYETDVKSMASRAIASVYTEDSDAITDNMENNTLLRCL